MVGGILAPSVTVARALEKKLHAVFAEKRLHGEWFDLGEKDVAAALDMARSIGLKTVGCGDGDEISVTSSLELQISA